MPASVTPRLLWITERYPPDTGGMAVSCARQAAGLRQREMDVDLVVLAEGGKPGKIKEIPRDRGSDFFLFRESHPGLSAQVAWRLVQELQAKRPYSWVVGFGANLPGFVAVTFAAWLDLPSLVMVRGNDLDRDWFEPHGGRWVREALARASVVGTVSAEKTRLVRSLFPGKDVRWTPNGVDVSRWELLPADRKLQEETRGELAKDGRRVMGLFGEMKFKKRVPLWLAALREAGLVDRVSLLVVGRLDEETRQIIEDPSLAPPHRHLNFCAREQLPGLYAACDFMVLPSLFDGLPNVLLEAMACGVVPIASTAGAMAQVVEDGKSGFLFPPEDQAAAGKATARAVALSPAKLARMSSAARNRVARHFSIDAELDILGSIFRIKMG